LKWPGLIELPTEIRSFRSRFNLENIMQDMPDASGRTLLYRFLTGEDDSAFCHKVSLALSKGWELYGDPQYTSDPASGTLRCGQAVIKRTDEVYDPDRKLGEY
jgi:hypothetical protein